jgi:hypothetical protein
MVMVMVVSNSNGDVYEGRAVNQLRFEKNKIK